MNKNRLYPFPVEATGKSAPGVTCLHNRSLLVHSCQLVFLFVVVAATVAFVQRWLQHSCVDDHTHQTCIIRVKCFTFHSQIRP